VPEAAPTDESLFAAASELLPRERPAFLDGACTDPIQRARVDGLLRSHEGAGSFLGRPVLTPPTANVVPPSESPGHTIGPYKLVEEIGEGGMGMVYLAQQQNPVKRLVAIKVIKSGMDSRQVLARFEAERQALALMDHPNIARVFDGGMTESGRPYFVMELVKGMPITRYCDDHRLTPNDRLELFVQVCQAVQHAHTKGVIHRDLKPSNVLVAPYDGKPVVKVIDFGVAKAAGVPLTEKTLVTGFGAVVGTPEYMSPEQAELNNRDIDTRSDVYSLGILLYELLTGSTPLTAKRVKEAALLEVLRVIREEEPPRPSTRLSTTEELPSIAAVRGVDPAKLSRLVRGELDWIVMKALEKDRSRRYETANALAIDIQRYLADEPVQACPPSAGYRLRKFLRRNRFGLAAAGLVLLVLISLSGSIGWAARDRAIRQAVLDDKVGQALVDTENSYRSGKLPDALAAVKRAEDLLASGDGGRVLRERVDRWRTDLAMVTRLEQIRLEKSPTKDGHIDLPRQDADYEEALRQYGLDVETLEVEEAAARVRAHEIAVDLAVALDDWANVRRQTRPGDKSWQHLVAVARSADPEPMRMRLRDAWGRKAKDVRDELNRLAAQERVPTLHPTTVSLLAATLVRVGLSNEAADVLRRAQRQHPNDFWINLDLGSLLTQLKPPRPEQAIGFFRAAVALRPQSSGAHLFLSIALRDSIRTHRTQNELEEAEAEAREAIRLNSNSAVAHNGLGVVLGDKGLIDDAIVEYRTAVEIDPRFAMCWTNLGNSLRQQKKLVEATAALRKALEIDPKYAMAWDRLGLALADQNKHDDAMAAFREAIRIDPEEGGFHRDLGMSLGPRGRTTEAEAEIREAIRLRPDDPNSHDMLGVALGQQRKYPESELAHREAIRLKPDYYGAHKNLGIALRHQGKFAEAETAYREAIRIKPDYGMAHFGLARVLEKQGRPREAIAAFEAAIRFEPGSIAAHAEFGRLLATCPESSLRNPRRAVELARAATNLDPQSILAWQILGWAYYRVGNSKGSIEALEESCRLQKGGDDGQWIVLALAHWTLGSDGTLPDAVRALHRTETQSWYDKAVKQIDGNRSPGDETMQAIRAFRAEAAKLLEGKD